MSEQFNGDGFDGSPFTDEDLRKHRHMYKVIKENYLPMTPEDLKSVQFVTVLRKAWPLIIGGPFVTGIAKSMGWF